MENLFLTEARRAVLDGTTDREGNSLAVEKSRIRERARLAVEELIAVAASPEIENSDVFEPNDLARLIDALMVPKGEGLTPRWNFDGDPAEFRDEYQYQIGLQSRLDHALDGYQEMLHRDYPPGETRQGLIDDNE